MDDVINHRQRENAAEVLTQLSRDTPPAAFRTQQLTPAKLNTADQAPAPVRHFVEALLQRSPPNAQTFPSITSHVEALVTQLSKSFYQHAWLELGHCQQQQLVDDTSDHLSADLIDRLMNWLADHLIVQRFSMTSRPPIWMCRLRSTPLTQELLTDMLYADHGDWELASDPVPNGMSGDEASRHHAHAFCLKQYNQFLQKQSFPLKGPVSRRFCAGPLSNGELTCDAGLLAPDIDTLINGAPTARIRSSNIPARSSPCSTQSQEASATPGTQARHLQNEVAMKMLNWALAHEITVLPQVDGAFIVPASAATAAAHALDKAWELTLGEAEALADEASAGGSAHDSLPIAV